MIYSGPCYHSTRAYESQPFQSPKKAALHQAKEILVSRIALNNYFVEYFKKISSEQAQLFFLDHFVKPESRQFFERALLKMTDCSFQVKAASLSTKKA